jgi:hypothetical protein
MTRVLSLDPGGTTGYAISTFEDDSPLVIERSGQIKNSLHGFLDFHWDVLESEDIDLIVCESFELREGVYGADLSPVQVIGALEALYPTVPIWYQAPYQKPLVDDDRLKKLGLYEPGKPHRNDAVRHMVIYLRNNKHTPTLAAGWKD